MAAQLVSVLPLNVRVIAKTISACWFVHSLRMEQSEASRRKKTAEEEEKHSTQQRKQQQQQKPCSNKWPTVHRSRATMSCLRLSKSTERPRRIRLLPLVPLWLACCCFAGNFQYQTARYTSLNHMPPFYIHQKVFKHLNARSVYIKGRAHVFRNLHINDHQVKSLFYATHTCIHQNMYTHFSLTVPLVHTHTHSRL